MKEDHFVNAKNDALCPTSSDVCHMISYLCFVVAIYKMSVLRHLYDRKDCAGPTFKNVSCDSAYASFGGNFLCKDRHLPG